MELAHQAEPAILMADDDPGALFALHSVLGDLDADLVTASSGKQAMLRLLKQDFCVILMDVKVPAWTASRPRAWCLRGRARAPHRSCSCDTPDTDNGEDGFMLARRTRPAAIMLALELPDTDSWTIADRINADHAIAQLAPPIRVMLLAADNRARRGAIAQVLDGPGRAFDVVSDASAALAGMLENAGMHVNGDESAKRRSGSSTCIRASTSS